MINLHIEGMSCSHCEVGVMKALQSVAGVKQVLEVSAERKTATVEGDTDVRALLKAVRDQGYSAIEI